MPFPKVLGTVLHCLVVFMLALIPTLLLNLPVGLIARASADAQVAIALKGSNVKVRHGPAISPPSAYPHPHPQEGAVWRGTDKPQPLNEVFSLLFSAPLSPRPHLFSPSSLALALLSLSHFPPVVSPFSLRGG